MQREVTVELSSKNFRRTGIFSDVCQHAMLLPVLTHHLRSDQTLCRLNGFLIELLVRGLWLDKLRVFRN